MRQRRFDDLARMVGLFGRPVPERRAEAKAGRLLVEIPSSSIDCYEDLHNEGVNRYSRFPTCREFVDGYWKIWRWAPFNPHKIEIPVGGKEPMARTCAIIPGTGWTERTTSATQRLSTGSLRRGTCASTRLSRHVDVGVDDEVVEHTKVYVSAKVTPEPVSTCTLAGFDSLRSKHADAAVQIAAIEQAIRKMLSRGSTCGDRR